MGALLADYAFPVALGFGIGASVVLCTPIMTQKVEAGDLLSFSGALIGVGIAVFGAIAVDRERERRTDERKMERLISSIEKLEAARLFFAHYREGQSQAASAMELRHRALILRSAVRAFQNVLERIDVDDVDLWSTINSVSEGFPELIKVLNDAIAYDWGSLPDAKLTDQRMTIISQYLQIIVPWLVKAAQLAKAKTAN